MNLLSLMRAAQGSQYDPAAQGIRTSQNPNSGLGLGQGGGSGVSVSGLQYPSSSVMGQGGGGQSGGGYGVQGPGQESAEMMAGLQNMSMEESGLYGAPPSLLAALQQANPGVPTAQSANFAPYMQGGQPDLFNGSLLPDYGSLPDPTAWSPGQGQQANFQPQSTPVDSGQQQQQMAASQQGVPGSMNNPTSQRDIMNQQVKQGFGSLLNFQGTPENPNIFLRLAEGYNRGGLIGSIGQALTRY